MWSWPGKHFGPPWALWPLLGGLVQSRVNENHQSHHPVQHHAPPQPQSQMPPPQEGPSPALPVLTPSPGPVTPLSSPLPLAAAFWQITHVFLPKEALSCRDCGAAQSLGPASGPSSSTGSYSASPVLQLLHPNLQNIPTGAPSSVPAPNQPEPTLAPGHPHPTPHQFPMASGGSQAGDRQWGTERDLLSTRCLSTGGEWISAR